jgi:catechol 2,3-dioxygenase-like lactoylglutathione lyase family enzyme
MTTAKAMRHALVGARVISALALGLLAAWAALPAAAALANPPTFETLYFSFNGPAPFFTQACGFPVVRHQERTVRVALFTDQSGAVIKEADHYSTSGSLVANGIAVNFNDSGPQHWTFYADGSEQVVQEGVTLNYRGTGFHLAGRLVEVYDPDGNVLSSSFTGSDQGSLADVCAALTP